MVRQVWVTESGTVCYTMSEAEAREIKEKRGFLIRRWIETTLGSPRPHSDDVQMQAGLAHAMNNSWATVLKLVEDVEKLDGRK